MSPASKSASTCRAWRIWRTNWRSFARSSAPKAIMRVSSARPAGPMPGSRRVAGPLAEALDLTREPQSVRDRYGYGSSEPAGYGDAGPLLNTYFLTARRLVEAGVRCVTLAYGRWDWHGQPHGTTFENARDHLPMLDQGVSALVDDLHQRGLDQDVSVVVWGEFGRTPQINRDAGRDHWPAVACALLAGGGMRTGQVIGSTDRLAGQARERPVTFAEVFATLYH